MKIEETKSEDWSYNSYWDEDEGLVEWYTHKETDESISVDEYYDVFKNHNIFS